MRWGANPGGWRALEGLGAYSANGGKSGLLPYRKLAGFGCVLGALVLLAGLGGCGTPGPPRPPSLELPEPVTGLVAARAGDLVMLRWTMPRTSTDNLALRGPVGFRVCRAVAKEPCGRANEFPGRQMVEPGQAGEFQDALPRELATGPPRLITYSIELVNHAGQSAGPSNAAYAASGGAPAALRSLAAEVRADGVLLRWEPAAEDSPSMVRLHRKLVEVPGAAPPVVKKTQFVLTQPAGAAEATLLVPEQAAGAKAGATLDADALADRTYTYIAERVFEVVLDGHRVEVVGQASEAVTVVTRDVFPPAVPSGLVVLTVPEERAIDLSWNPDSEPDLAGYVVYRRESGAIAVKLSGETVVPAAYRDAGAVAGHRYFYSVSAVDRDGNESGRSVEVEEGLPPN